MIWSYLLGVLLAPFMMHLAENMEGVNWGRGYERMACYFWGSVFWLPAIFATIVVFVMVWLIETSAKFLKMNFDDEVNNG